MKFEMAASQTLSAAIDELLAVHPTARQKGYLCQRMSVARLAGLLVQHQVFIHYPCNESEGYELRTHDTAAGAGEVFGCVIVRAGIVWSTSLVDICN